MSYEKDIFNVLQEAGDTGLTVRKIVRHIYNAHNSFFETASESDISRAVQRYLTYHSKRPGDTIVKVGYGRYRLNMRSSATKELMLKFDDGDSSPAAKPAKDMSLDLFQ
jgi:hypothetical protein